MARIPYNPNALKTNRNIRSTNAPRSGSGLLLRAASDGSPGTRRWYQALWVASFVVTLAALAASDWLPSALGLQSETPAAATTPGDPAVGDNGADHSATPHAPAKKKGNHADEGGGHSDPFARILALFAAVVFAAMTGRWTAMRLGQPGVLGELLIGIVMGNIGYALGEPLFILIMHTDQVETLIREAFESGAAIQDLARAHFDARQLEPGGVGERIRDAMLGPGAPQYVLSSVALWMFSNLGVVLLLFMVGLESSIDEMMRVGGRAVTVAIVGVVAPFSIGFGASIVLLPDAHHTVHLFLAATLTATSVGITARVFRDMGRLQTPDAKLILGAAVIDDILGLLILAVTIGIVESGEVSVIDITRTTSFALIFMGVLIFLGDRIVDFMYRYIRRLDPRNHHLLFPLGLLFMLSWLANLIGLATIIGAFAAGLLIDEELFGPKSRRGVTIERLVSPLETLFAPIFFVLIGMQVNVALFLEMDTLLMGAALTVAAIIGKLVCGLVAGKGVSKLTVGIGMVPRGEVGLIFASVGKSVGVVSGSLFSAVVLMVIVTTLITPIALRYVVGPASDDDAGADDDDEDAPAPIAGGAEA